MPVPGTRCRYTPCCGQSRKPFEPHFCGNTKPRRPVPSSSANVSAASPGKAGTAPKAWTSALPPMTRFATTRRFQPRRTAGAVPAIGASGSRACTARVPTAGAGTGNRGAPRRRVTAHKHTLAPMHLSHYTLHWQPSTSNNPKLFPTTPIPSSLKKQPSNLIRHLY